MIPKINFIAAMSKYAKILPFGAPDFRDADVCDFWHEQLGHISAEDLGKAMKDLCQKAKFPSISDIKAKCGITALSDEEVARDAISRIRYAIGRFGYNNWDLAKTHIGTLGEHIVQTMGGWETVCSFSSYDDLDFALVQAREYAKVAIKKSAAGKLSDAPELPSANAVNDVVSGLLKRNLLAPPKEDRH